MTAGRPWRGAGQRNLITDVEGVLVGNAEDISAKTGTTALICEKPSVASCHVMGGAPGSRDTDLLSPENTVEHVDALFLSGGSAFGLDAASGIQSVLRQQGRGFDVGGQKIPIVPGAILFDMVNGGAKEWDHYPPYRELGVQAAATAETTFDLGSTGAGHGALVAGMKGGLGSASTRLANGATIGALVAVNALGSPTMGNSGKFWAAPFEIEHEFGGLGLPGHLPDDAADISIKFREEIAPGTNTTIGIIATDMALTKSEAKRLAVAAHDGFARAIWPAHTPLDGDMIFAISTATKPKPANLNEWIDLCALAASTMSRAIARGIYSAEPLENDIFPCWKEVYGK